MKRNFTQGRRGQSLIELLVAIAIGALFVISVATVISPSLRENTQAQNVQIGAALGKELLDNVRVWAGHDWRNILSLATGTVNTYYLNTTSSPFQVVSGSSSTFPNGYAYRRTITIQGSQVSQAGASTTLTNFPVMISTVSSPLADMVTGSGVQSSNGNDILFTSDASGTIPLYSEQESYSSSTGAMVYWVQIPTLTKNVDTPIYMFYGKSGIASAGYFPQQVWDSNYKGVFHLSNIAATTPDSTSNNNAGTVTSATATSSGQIGTAASFVAGSSQYISAPINLSGATQVTAEFWLYQPAYISNAYAAGFTTSGNTTLGGFDILPSNGSSKLEVWATGNTATNDNVYTRPATGWHHYVLTEDLTVSTNQLNLYLDGSSYTTGLIRNQNGNNTNSLINSTFYMMTRGDGTKFNTGTEDEVRISSNLRSADWINTEYRNQNSPGTFYIMGSATTPSGGSILTENVTLGGITYGRAFSVFDVYRSSTGTIVASSGAGTYDPSSKKITVTYSWPGATGGSMSTILTRSQNNVFTQTDWSGGSGQNGPATSTNNQFAASTNIDYTTLSGSLTLLTGTSTGGGSSSSSGNGYAFYKTITIDHTKVPNTDQSNFPMLFSGTYSYLAASSSGGNVKNANGYDIIFTSDASGTVQLAYERETYASSTGRADFWVKIPSLSHTVDTVIYLFYGNASTTTDQSNKNGVWDSNYKLVYHLPDGTTLNTNDSTANANNGSNTGGTAASGQIGGGVSFSPNSYIGNTTGINPASFDISFSMWIKSSAISGSDQNLLSQNNGTGVGRSWVYSKATTGEFRTVLGGTDTSLGTIMTTGSWSYITFTKSGTTGKLYINGNPTSTVTLGASESADGNERIGVNKAGLGGFNGVIDEVRISSTVRSADWVKTEYNNQSSPATFYSVL